MVVLGGEVFVSSHNLSDDPALLELMVSICVEHVLKFFLHFFGYLFLFLRVPENRRAVLRTSVISLPSSGGWVMERKKELNEILIAALRGIHENMEHLNMPGGSLAHVFIRWVLHAIWVRAHEPY